MTQMLLTNWSIFTSSVLAVIIFLSYGNSETFDFTKCDITDNFKSELVSASFKSLEPGVGCESNGTSSSGQEVHIIVVKPQVSDNERRITVRLNIHSRKHSNMDETERVNFQEGPRPVIFVLHSSLAITWKIEMYGINSQQKHLFMLSKESSIRFQRKRTRLMAKTRKRLLPFTADNSTIYNWTKKRFGSVTSYSETTEFNVKFYIGRDVSAGSYCDLNALSSSLRIFSYHEVVRPIIGCVSKRRNQHVRAKPVYIIELLEPPAPSPGMIGVDLEILPYLNGKNLRSNGQNVDSEQDWHFYLVVKSPPSLRWTLHSKEISGWVDIVADASADVKVTGVKISTVALRVDDIKVTGKQLVEWSQDYIAPVQMYAGIHAANTIKLQVPPLDKNMASTRERVTAVNQNDKDPKMPKEGGLVGGDEYGKIDKHEDLGSLIQITCMNQEIEVVISKKFFQITGLDETKVTLKDPTCQPTIRTNEDIIFCTGLRQCGTHSHDLDNMTSFINAVVIQATPSLMSGLLPHEMGSGSFEEDSSSGARDLVMDDEDYTLNPVTLPLECKLPKIAVNQSSKELNASDFSGHICRQKELQATAKCNISLYTRSPFLLPTVEFPVTVAKNSTVYIKAFTDQETSILVHSCWFSTSSQPFDHKVEVKMLVSKGCREDDSLSWLDDQHDSGDRTNLPYIKFAVKVSDMFKSRSPLYLHCQFQTCHGHNRHPQECLIDGHDGCRQFIQQTPHSPLGVQSSLCGPLTLGPLSLADKEVFIIPHLGGSSTKRPGSTQEVLNKEQEQRIIIEGLDSVTVVGISFAAFVIGILLMGSLWFIHSHTGPKKIVLASLREPETCGDRTPNSCSPMTA